MIVAFFLAKNTIEAAKEQKEVVVATGTIKPYTVIKSDMVTLKKVNKESALDAYTNPDEIIGKVSVGVILPDEPIRPGHIQDIRYNRLSGTIPHDKVVVAIPSNLELDVAQSVKVGDRVDLYALYEKSYKLVLPSAIVRSPIGVQEEESALGDTGGGRDGLILEIYESELSDYLFALSQGARFVAALKTFTDGKDDENAPMTVPTLPESNPNPLEENMPEPTEGNMPEPSSQTETPAPLETNTP